jgi:predicted PurR-regulated permease PerM
MAAGLAAGTHVSADCRQLQVHSQLRTGTGSNTGGAAGALMQGTSTALTVVALYTGIQVLPSALMQPLVQKKMVNLPPALVIIAQVSLGLVTGFWGVLLAAPIVAIITKIVDELYISRQPA